MKRFVYADNAATTKLSERAKLEMIPWLENEYGNPSQPYLFARNAKKAIERARSIIAECIGASPEEIYFTSGGTESNNWVIHNSAFLKNGRDGIITSSIEHHAILMSCDFESQYRNRSITYLPVTSQGLVDCLSLERAISKDCILVSIMTANNEIGSIQPIQDLAFIAHKHNCYFHTDAVQALGHIKVNIQELNVDFMSASAHKFNGPKGVGFLFMKRGIQLPSFINGGGQESGFRAGTESVASIVGMAAALQENIECLNSSHDRLLFLENKLITSLSNLGVKFTRNGADYHTPGNISLSFPGYEGEAILHRMDLNGICISTGSACDSQTTHISHVLKAIGLDEYHAKGTIRISLGKDNTLDDVNAIVSTLHRITNP